MSKPETPLQIMMRELDSKRNQMKAGIAYIGEPCIEIPLDKVSVFKGQDGILRGVIGVTTLIYLVDDFMRAK